MHRRPRRLLLSLLAAGAALAPAAVAHAAPLSPAGTWGGYDQPVDAAVVDLNQDDHPDLVVAARSGVWMIWGADRFRPSDGTVVGTPTSRLAVGDMDGDGRDDLVALDPGGAVTVVLSTQLGGDPLPAVTLPAGDWDALALADVDGDGRLDVVAGDRAGGLLATLRGAAGGTLGAPQTGVYGGGIGDLAARDIDGDGHADVALADDGPPSAPDGWLRVLFGRPDATYDTAIVPPVHLASPPASVAITAEDHPVVVVGDGHPEVVRVSRNGQVAPPEASPVAVSAFAMGDLTEDGLPDLAALRGMQVAVLPSDANRTFAADPAPVALGAAPSRVALGDADGDGHLDAVVVQTAAGTVALLRNGLTSGADVAPAALSWAADQITATQTVTVTSTGTGRVHVGRPWLYGPDAERFALVPSCHDTDLPAGASCDVAVRGLDVAGPHPAWTATLVIPTSAGTREVPLSVAALDPPPAPSPAAPAVAPARCRVPALRGLTLAGAGRRLLKAHCALGDVARPRRRPHGPGLVLVVVAQRPAPGTRRAPGGRVSVRAGYRHMRKTP